GPGSGRPRRGQLAAVNAVFFGWFAVCLILYVAGLAVALFSSVVAEERAGKRWEILLTTDLRPREILVGKAAGRVPLLLDPILAAVPVLCIATLFGGVSPTLVLLVFAAALALAVGVGGVALFYSVFSQTAGKAAAQCAGFWFIYLATSGMVIGLWAVTPLRGFPANRGV